jgi:thymidylate synthase
MKNNIDTQYLELCDEILNFGTQKKTRNGEVLSVFGRTIRHSMKDGFPLLTTKKMAWKTMVTELLWFLRGDTNIKYLVDNGCHIWEGDAYKRFLNETIKVEPVDAKQRAVSQLLNSKESQDEFINKIKTDDEFAKKFGELGPVYGKQWRRWGEHYKIRTVEGEGSFDYEFKKKIRGIDQIANVINLLKTDPDSRRMIVNAYNVGELNQMVLPPCHMMFQFYTRELSLTERNYSLGQGKAYKGIFGRSEKNDLEYKELFDKENRPTRAISLRWDQRSVDVGLGLPFNIASYALLLELVAKSVNMVPEEVIGDLGDCHIYNNHIDGLKEQLTRTPYELPSLNINTEFWPTESGECGVGPIDATAVFNSFTNDHFCKCLLEDDIQLYKYQSHPSIKLPLSN